MPFIVLLCLLTGVAVWLLGVLFLRERRARSALEQVSQQVQSSALNSAGAKPIQLSPEQPELAALVIAVNQLLARSPAVVERIASRCASLDALGDRVHEAVLIHTSAIRYANPQFASLLGSSVERLIGRQLAELVRPEYAELVADNLRRRLAGEPAVERYEAELAAPDGPVLRLEFSSWPIEYRGERALLIIGVEVLPTQSLQALPEAGGGSRARRALESIPEALVTTDSQGHIDYLNPAAARLLGVDAAAAGGASLEELAQVVEESDRKLLGEPLRQALGAGAPLNIGRRAFSIRTGGHERLIREFHITPSGVEIGQPLREFEGVLTGVPVYKGTRENLLSRSDAQLAPR